MDYECKLLRKVILNSALEAVCQVKHSKQVKVSLETEMDLNEEHSFLPPDSEDAVCDWKNIDMYLDPWQLAMGILTVSFIIRSPSCSFDCGKQQGLWAPGSPFGKYRW